MADGRDIATGKFLKGNRGGPGRPRGLGSRPSFASLVGEEAIARLAQKVLTLALEGDATCLKVAADRLWPALNRAELSGIEGEAIQVEAPDWKSWSTEELEEVRAAAARIAQMRAARAKG